MATRKKKTTRKGKRYTPKGKVGTGTRFKQLTKELRKRKKVRDPKALAAAIGRRKFGKKKMTKMAAAGRKKKTTRKKRSTRKR